MIIKYAIALAVLLLFAAAFRWAFLPARYLPGNRVRHLRTRLHLRLHPGKGFATIFGLWLRWGRLAALRRSGRIRRSLPLWYRMLAPGECSVFAGPGALAARAAGPAGRARAGDGAAADLQDRVPGRRHPPLPRPGDRHHHQGRHLRADGRGAGPARPGARVQPAAHRRRAVHVPLVPGRRLRRPGDRGPPRGRVRVRGLPEGRGRRHVLVRQGQ